MDFTRLSRAFEAVAAFVGTANRVLGATRRPEPPPDDLVHGRGPVGALGPLEARLAGVVVAALKEAFDRDSARLDLERQQLEAERQRAEAERLRAERLLRLERLRQAADREIGQLRGTAALSVFVWVTSAVFVVVAGRGVGLGVLPVALVAAGWVALLGGLVAAAKGYHDVTKGLAEGYEESGRPPHDLHGPAASAAPWLAIIGLALTASGLLVSVA
ncbi:MAG: hypothetical protein ACE148_13745 [Vicinamibacterales bacterium]